MPKATKIGMPRKNGLPSTGVIANLSEGWVMPLDVLLFSDAGDLSSVLTALSSCAHTVRRRASIYDDGARRDGADVAIVDARTDATAARALCARLTAATPPMAVVGVVAAADVIAADVDWCFDDVIVSDIGAPELCARLQLAVNRRRSEVDRTLQFGDLVVHPGSFTASLGGQDVDLTLTEFKLLDFLVQRAGRAFTRARLMREVWGCDDGTGQTRTVDVHVQRVRAKLGAQHQSMVDTVRGVGYMARTPPYPTWIVNQPTPHPTWIPDLAAEDSAIPPPAPNTVADQAI